MKELSYRTAVTLLPRLRGDALNLWNVEQKKLSDYDGNRQKS